MDHTNLKSMTELELAQTPIKAIVPVDYIAEEINHQAEINSLIWDRDSYGLYDYESKVLEESRTTQAGCGMLIREDNYKIKSITPLEDEDQQPKEKSQKLCSLVYKHGLYWVYHS